MKTEDVVMWLILVGLAAIVGGCFMGAKLMDGGPLSNDAIDRARRLCEPNDGLLEIAVFGRIKCKNGAFFEPPSSEKAPSDE